MTERLADIVTQIQNVRQLEAVVTAMRGIAASRAQQGRSLLAGIEAYAGVISDAIGQALGLLPASEQVPSKPRAVKRGLILFCAEQGFAGLFSERILDAVAHDLNGATIFLVGTRGLAVAKERGVEPAWSTSMATHIDAIADFANRLTDALYDHVATGAIEQADILFARSVPGSIEVQRHSLLPLDLTRFTRPAQNLPPLVTLAPWRLLEHLAAEYVYAELCQAAMHAFAAENEARMAAMASAKTNIASKLAGLSLREHQLRQEQITTEIIELAAGAQLLSGAS